MKEISLTGQSVRWLQYMLNTLAMNNPSLPRLVINGTFDEPTLEAVMIFQRDNSLPVTGVVNQQTWEAITNAYEKDQLVNGAPSPLRVFHGNGVSIPQGESSEQMLLSQAMLSSLSRALSNFNGQKMDGCNSGETLDNIRLLQSLAGLPVTGTLDRATWEYLSRLYHTFVTRADQF